MKPVAVVGNLACDLVDDRPPRTGGAPFHCGRALRALGRPARIVTKLAEADRPALLPALVALGVPVTWRPASSTTTFTLRYTGEERRMETLATGEPWSPDDARGWVAEALEGVGWVHAGALLRTDFPPETLAELARGRRLSLEGQALVRRPEIGPLVLDADFDPEVLRHVTVLKLSEEEARVLAPELDERSLRELGVPEVVVTLGSKGVLVLADGLAEHVPGREARGVKDPTGAGDAFVASYVAARNAGDEPIAAASQATALVAGLLSGRL